MKSQKYRIYQKGLFVGTLSLTPDRIRNLERHGFVVKPLKVAVKNATRKRKIRRDTERVGTTRLHRANPYPKGLVKIYDKITRIEGTKGKSSAYPGQKFFHNFKRPYPAMYGTPDRKALIIK